MACKLYFAPGTCSLVPHIALELTGQPFDTQLIKAHKGELRSPEFLALNPMGQVPVLQDGDEVVTQIIAITLYLDALHPQAGLFPQELLARTHAIETMAWINNTVHTTFNRVFKPDGSVDDSAMQAAVRDKAKQTYATLMQRLQDKVVAAQAKGLTFLSGATLGAVDAYALTVIRWAQVGGMQPEQLWPQLWAYAEQVATQPAVHRALERERITLRTQALV